MWFLLPLSFIHLPSGHHTPVICKVASLPKVVCIVIISVPDLVDGNCLLSLCLHLLSCGFLKLSTVSDMEIVKSCHYKRDNLSALNIFLEEYLIALFLPLPLVALKNGADNSI